MPRLKVCTIDEIAAGTVKQIKLAGRDPIAIYNLDGEFFAADDVCTHGRAVLSGGTIENGNIVCPFHGGKFDIRTGTPTGYPCIVAIRTYAISKDGDALIVDLGDD